MEDILKDPWEDYKDELYEFVSNKSSVTITSIMDWIGGIHTDVKLAAKELLLSGNPIIVKDEIVKIIYTDLERKEEMAEKVKRLKELQEEINALKELKFEVKE